MHPGHVTLKQLGQLLDIYLDTGIVLNLLSSEYSVVDISREVILYLLFNTLSDIVCVLCHLNEFIFEGLC